MECNVLIKWGKQKETRNKEALCKATAADNNTNTVNHVQGVHVEPSSLSLKPSNSA